MQSWVLAGFSELRELGAGGSGRVVLARHDVTGTEVAIKYLAPWLSEDEDQLASFRSEAELMAGLVDPYLVALYEYVETDAGAAIVMQVLEGVSLRALLDRDGPLQPEGALLLLKGSLLGLAALHDRGVAHRDFKPGNVVVTGDGMTTLIDYGIAVPIGRLTQASGTPLYMAPEQWAGEPSSAATDVYAATATFVECLLGHPAFSGDTVPALYRQHLTVPPPLDELPEAVRPLAEAGLAKDPTIRISDASVLIARLDAVAGTTYGDEWEVRGRAELAARAALLAFLFAHARPVGVDDATAETDLGHAQAADAGDSLGVPLTRRPPPRLRRRSRARPSSRRRLVRSGIGLLALAAAAIIVMDASAGTAPTSAAFAFETVVSPAATPTPSVHVLAPPTSAAPAALPPGPRPVPIPRPLPRPHLPTTIAPAAPTTTPPQPPTVITPPSVKVPPNGPIRVPVDAPPGQVAPGAQPAGKP